MSASDARDVWLPPGTKHPARPFLADARDVVQLRGWPDHAIAAIAARQRTLITCEQLLALGVGRAAVSHSLSRGRLHPVHRGVYSLVPKEALPPLALEQAALFACGAGTYLSHHTAAAIWGLRPHPHGPVDVTIVGREAGRRRAAIRLHRVRTLDQLDTRTRARLPITSPVRTLLDIAPKLSARELERAFDEGLARDVVTVEGLLAVLARYPGRPGSAALRALAQPDRAVAATQSGGEEVFLALIRKAGLPAPEVGARLGHYTADFLWRKERVVVEIDGFAFHRGRFAFERDRRRDTEHAVAGFLVLRFTAKQLEQEPEMVLARVAAVLAMRAAA